MAKKNRITIGGNIAQQGQKSPTTIVLTQPKRFGIDIADVIQAVRSFDNVDYSRRIKLYDLYTDILMDTHLYSVIEKRMLAVLSSPISFKRNEKTDDIVGEQIRSPWFRKAIRDIMWAQMWGNSLLQFHKEGDWLNYDLIPRKHVDPVRKLILRHQTDLQGTPWDYYADLLFVGSPDDLGLLAKAAPWVIYKRNTTADWAQFSEVFGMPIREYIYDTDDEDARQRALDDASNEGSLAVLVHSKDSEMKLVEVGNKTGSAEVYERLVERCNNEISKLILGNTLTTESSKNGTQALGTVHKKVENQLAEADRQYVLDTLNYEMSDIFAHLGINTVGGEFFFPNPKEVDLTSKMNIISQLKKNFNLPIDDDYLYQEFGVEKPKNYDKLVAVKTELENQPPVQLELENPKPNTPVKKAKKTFSSWFHDFFAQASQGGAHLDW